MLLEVWLWMWFLHNGARPYFHIEVRDFFNQVQGNVGSNRGGPGLGFRDPPIQICWTSFSAMIKKKIRYTILRDGIPVQNIDKSPWRTTTASHSLRLGTAARRNNWASGTKLDSSRACKSVIKTLNNFCKQSKLVFIIFSFSFIIYWDMNF